MVGNTNFSHHEKHHRIFTVGNFTNFSVVFFTGKDSRRQGFASPAEQRPTWKRLHKVGRIRPGIEDPPFIVALPRYLFMEDMKMWVFTELFFVTPVLVGAGNKGELSKLYRWRIPVPFSAWNASTLDPSLDSRRLPWWQRLRRTSEMGKDETGFPTHV